MMGQTARRGALKAFLDLLRDLGLLVARVVVGLILVMRGWERWMSAGIEAQTAILHGAGMPAAELLAWLVVAFEILGGGLLLFGLGTRIIGLGVAVLNVGTILLLDRLDPANLQGGGWEANALLATLGVVLLTNGAGRTGLDALFLRPDDEQESELIAAEDRN